VVNRKCFLCGSAATTHFQYQKIVMERRFSICQKCLDDSGLAPDAPADIKKLIEMHILQENDSTSLFDMTMELYGYPMVVEVNEIPDKCPTCGVSMSDMLKKMKVGCPECYVYYGKFIDVVLERLREQDDTGGDIEDELSELKTKLMLAIDDERYEDAAKIRDMIKNEDKE
jgi:protein-arginine kinase activator protein McsA